VLTDKVDNIVVPIVERETVPTVNTVHNTKISSNNRNNNSIIITSSGQKGSKRILSPLNDENLFTNRSSDVLTPLKKFGFSVSSDEEDEQQVWRVEKVVTPAWKKRKQQ